MFCALYHLLRSKYTIFDLDEVSRSSGPNPEKVFPFLEEDPLEIRTRLLKRLDLFSFGVFLTAVVMLVLLAYTIRNTTRILPWIQVILVLGATILAGAGTRYLIGVRYVHNIKTLLHLRYLILCEHRLETGAEVVGLDILKSQFHSLLFGYVSQEELNYMVDSYHNKLGETTTTAASLHEGH